MTDIKYSFKPFYDKNSVVLILGSFPSVKSRETQFYYGNPRNSFWKILSAFFCEEEPRTTEEKKSFLSRHQIALWDVVTECEINGSSDSSLKPYEYADIESLLSVISVKYILINGGKARSLFEKQYKNIDAEIIPLPSTSPANARKGKEETWHAALRRAFGKT